MAQRRRVVVSVVLALAGCSNSDGDAPPGDGGVDAGPDAPPSGSLGCGKASSIAGESWVMRGVAVGGANRDYFIRLPAGYDPERRYQVVYQQHGCSSSPNRETNNVPLEGQAGPDAILVRGKAAADCWDTSPNGPDVAYWDAMVADVEASWCIDPSRRFATGYSSGAFMTHRLACIRGDRLRGVATIAGGQGESSCAGDVGALLIHDANDTTVDISASEQARASHLTRNGCDPNAAPTPTDHPPCVQYAGCAAGNPVVWCQTSGQNHSRQDGLAAPIFWDFLSGL